MATTERDFYVILGGERPATDAEIKRPLRTDAEHRHREVNPGAAAPAYPACTTPTSLPNSSP